jgi:hypothetical protein
MAAEFIRGNCWYYTNHTESVNVLRVDLGMAVEGIPSKTEVGELDDVIVDAFGDTIDEKHFLCRNNTVCRTHAIG